MSDDTQQPIVVKRVTKKAEAGHSGTWKIAYADFVTAMMAFFLLMWLIGSTAKGDLTGIAEYFQTPLKVALAGGSGSGDSSSILQGGGQDLTRAHGQVKRGEVKAPRETINLQAMPQDYEKIEAERLENLKSQLEAMIDGNPSLRQFKKQLLLDITAEGLRIQIVDDQKRPMFATASAELKPYSREILRQIGKVLNDVPNKISVSGHTDASSYSDGDKGFGNWELSANRANAARRELVAGGMDDSKVMRVVGLGSAVPFDKSDPFSPLNRRMSIIVMNKKTEEGILRDGGVLGEASIVTPAAPNDAPSTPTQRPATQSPSH